MPSASDSPPPNFKMKKFLRIDENDDLGFDFACKNPSEYFAITLLLVNGIESNRIFKKLKQQTCFVMKFHENTTKKTIPGSRFSPKKSDATKTKNNIARSDRTKKIIENNAIQSCCLTKLHRANSTLSIFNPKK